MAVYAIGDLQGCYRALHQLLEQIQFDPAIDQLWFCGDLVNRGPDSLKTLCFVKSLGDAAITVLGNHDLHLLAVYYSGRKMAQSDTLTPLLASPDCESLLGWLQSRPLLHYDKTLSKLLVHAGIHPHWSLAQTLAYAAEVEQLIQSDSAQTFFAEIYADQPDRWSDRLSGIDRWRCIINILTRMRFFLPDGRLDFNARGKPQQHPDLIPWFRLSPVQNAVKGIVFGHWSSLPTGVYGQHFAIDGGCVWGGKLVALKLDEPTPKWISVTCQKASDHPQ